MLDEGALARSLSEILRRHEVLRTTFASAEGRPVQLITSPQPIDLRVVDLCELPPDEREAQAAGLAREEAQRPFDLVQGPLLRASLARLDPEEHLLLLVIHHIAFDAWSARVLVKDLSALYQAFSTENPSPLPEPPIQYADFAHWQRGWLQGQILEAQLSYWKETLAGAPPTLDLPTDHARPPVRSFRGARQSLRLAPSLEESLKVLSEGDGVTLFMILLAAFQTLLCRYTGQDDVVVGTPVAGRTHVEIEDLIGFFVNSLVMRTDLSGNPTFRELLARVRDVALAAYAHQDLPFEKLVEELQPERDLSRPPLFQVMFNLENIPEVAVGTGELGITEFEFDPGVASFDLHMEVVSKAEGLLCWLEYSTDLFEAATIKRMLRHFQTLLEGIVADPDQRLSDLPILTEPERHQLLVEWNDTQADYPRDASIHELFEDQVERRPESIAVAFESEQLTYQELNQRANGLARYLQSLGVGPEVMVGVCVERSLEMVIGLLAILKAGGAYLPLDPGYPAERLAFMLSDTRAPVLLTQQRLEERLPDYSGRVICLDADWPAMDPGQGEANLVRVPSAESLAYVMYTSGSTGRPKGVGVTHRNVVRLVKEANYASLTAEEAVLQFAPISFDASTLEIWGPLLNGGRLVVAPAHMPTLEELGHMIRRYQVTTLWLTAGLFHQMVEYHLGDLRSVRQLIAGGDVLSASHVRKVLRGLKKGCKLINGYGPTENTTFTTCYPMTGAAEVGATVSIGRPITSTQVYILDRHLNPAPIGVPGELYIGGDGLARGYLNRPELTAEKFIPNPFSSSVTGDRKTGSRLYRTGDLARYLPSGNIEFLGRLDQQVKIRGFRVEPGEIESVLGQHPAVRQAVVVAREDVPGDTLPGAADTRLVAYVVPNQVGGATVSEMRSFLKGKLPEHMIPSVFMLLDALPLTSNGKLDRRGLPTPNRTRPDLESAFAAPRTVTEELLSEIWGEVLGLEAIGTRDNFFELGGHSLLATQVISRIRDAFQEDLPLHSLFETPTVAGLAVTIDRRQAGEAQQEEIAAILAELEELSEDEVQRILDGEMAQTDEAEDYGRNHQTNR
jgi:aspartate racemase